MNIEPIYSSLDYPGKMSLVLFTSGCDLRCKYCHNPQLLKLQKIAQDDINQTKQEVENNLDFIDAIVLSGGEPLLQSDVIKQFIKQAKDENLLIKLDTNGLHPEQLKEVISDINYVAMDIKAPLDKYYKITDKYPADVKERILESINIIKNSGAYLECRTTYVPAIHTPSDIQKIADQINNPDQYTLQQFRNRATYDVGLLNTQEPNPEELKRILLDLKTGIENIHLKSGQFGNQKIR